MKLTTAQRKYQTILKEFGDKDSSFVANVIITSCDRIGTKLGNLLRLLRLSVSVHTAQFSLWTLVIDGQAYSYTILDNMKIVRKFGG